MFDMMNTMCMCLHTHICIIYYQRKFSCRASELRTVSNDDNNSSFVAVVAVVGVVGVASSRQFSVPGPLISNLGQ